MAGVVSDYMRRLLRSRVDDHGLVVWFDPQRHYGDLVADDELDGIAIERFDGSYLDLRRRVEPRLAPVDEAGEWRVQPGQVIVYLPVESVDAGDALVDLVVAGVMLEPRRSPWQLNTALDVIARHALRDVLPPGDIDAAVARAADGTLTLAELDRLADLGAGGFPLVASIFSTAVASDVARRFLTSDAHDAKLTERGAVAELGDLLAAAFDLPKADDADAQALRQRFSRYALLADFVLALRDQAPADLRGVALPPEGEARAALRRLIDDWRKRLDYAASYAEAAERVARELGRDIFDRLSLAGLRRVETFREGDVALQMAIERALREGGAGSAELIREAERRIEGVWGRQSVASSGRWRMIADAGRLLALADEIETALKRRKPNARTLLNHYAEGDSPWCLLDTHHRHLLRRYHELDTSEDTETLEQLVFHTRRRHTAVMEDLAAAFIEAYAAGDFVVSGVLAQVDLFARRVAPLLNDGLRTAYVLVDALRFEMGHELARNEGLVDWTPTLGFALGAFPSITKVGMAALMPGAERGLTLGTQGRSLAVEVGRVVVTTREQRLQLLDRATPADRVVCKLDDLIPVQPRLRQQLERALFALVTSQEIDLFGETLPAATARRTMDSILGDLVRGFGALRDCGFERIVVVADHGFLFGEDASAGERLDSPGGETIEIHRRVWIGRGGSTAPGFLRFAAANLGLGGDVELATPRGLGIFTTGGSSDYVHGGLTLQELVIPVLELARVSVLGTGAGAALSWTVTPGSKTLSARFFSVTIAATATELLPIEAPRVGVELRQGERQIGGVVSAGYGYDEATATVQLRPSPDNTQALDLNLVTLLVLDDPDPGDVGIVVTDANTGRELARVDGIPITLNR